MALLSEYGFNQGSGTTAADSSGNGHTLSGTSWVASAKTLSGAGGLFTAPTGIGPSGLLSTFTMMAWAKLGAHGAGDYIAVASSSTSNNPGTGFWLEAQNSGGALVYDVYNGINTITASTPVAYNTAVHVACVDNAGAYTLYLNGTSVGTTTGLAHDFSKTDWAIGGSNGDVSISGGDWIDEFRLFDTALSAAQVITYMNTPIGPSTGVPLNWINSIPN